ncbi:hypothetical protein DFH09DRAFT_1432137 [Mycena vulgaris]|nr:hypothetical protein DFH09DRAFT_1432137 [Mycena vulgaris]
MIFAHCDISSVVSTGRTCRYLHDLAFAKSIWLALLDDLKRRSILDSACTPDLQNLSTNDLIALVKRLVNGPDTWWPQASGFTPEVSKETILHPIMHDAPGGPTFAWDNEAKLLPKYEEPFLNPVVRGTLAAVALADRSYFIVDWKAQSSFVLVLPTYTASIVLIPGHLILKTGGIITMAEAEGGASGAEVIHLIISNAALYAHFSPVGGLEDVAEFNSIVPAQLAKLSTLSNPEAWRRLFNIWVHPSPLKHDSYRV